MRKVTVTVKCGGRENRFTRAGFRVIHPKFREIFESSPARVNVDHLAFGFEYGSLYFHFLLAHCKKKVITSGMILILKLNFFFSPLFSQFA